MDKELLEFLFNIQVAGVLTSCVMYAYTKYQEGTGSSPNVKVVSLIAQIPLIINITLLAKFLTTIPKFAFDISKPAYLALFVPTILVSLIPWSYMFDFKNDYELMEGLDQDVEEISMTEYIAIREDSQNSNINSGSRNSLLITTILLIAVKAITMLIV